MSTTSEQTVERSFWAIDGCRNIPELRLDTAPLRQYMPRGWSQLVYMTRLTNALRSLQRLDGSFINEPMTERLLEEAAETLEAAARDCPDEDIAELLRLRGRGVRRRDTLEAANAVARAENDRLVVLCGPLSTWPGKSSACLYSSCVAMEEAALTQQVRSLENSLPELGHYYEGVLGLRGLGLAPIPRFTSTNLLLCGGEANGFPKHFTYFLPEDEGHRRQPIRKTVLFTNVYLGRVRCLSLPLLSYFRDAPPNESQAAHPLTALTWFRGHDVGHFWRHPSAQFAKLREVLGRPRSYALQEALCDVFGYLALVGPWRPPSIDDRGLMDFYLSEMLRFVARSEDVHPDFEASYLVLSYLERNGYLEYDERVPCLHVDVERFNRGVLEVARRLASAVLGGSIEEALSLVELDSLAHGVRNPRLGQLMRAARALSNDIRYFNEE